MRDAYLSPLKVSAALLARRCCHSCDELPALAALQANTDKLLPTAVWSRTSDSAAKLVPDIQA